MVRMRKSRAATWDARLKKLERGITTKPTILYFSDGTTATIANLRGLLGCAIRGTSNNPEQARQLDMIRRSVHSKEPNGSLIVELARCRREDESCNCRCFRKSSRL